MAQIKLTQLKTCNLASPLGVDQQPVFSWIPQVVDGEEVHGKGQTAYQLCLYRGDELVWDSGKISSASCCQGVYAGPQLADSTDYTWQVRMWDEQYVVTDWSEPAAFTTGIWEPSGWRAKWIDAGDLLTVDDRIAPLFRKGFDVADGLTSAVLHICGMGLYTLDVNGQPADDTLLNPANTQMDVRLLYRTYHVEHLLHQGENTLSVELGNGFYNEGSGVWNWQTAAWRAAPKLLLQLELRYADGHSETVISDESWQCSADGPIRRNSIYLGETCDARQTIMHWQPADLAKAPEAALSAQLMQPMRRINTYAPESIRKLDDGSCIITSPEMLAGWAKLHLDAPKDTEVMILYGEQLKADGHVKRIGKNEGDCGGWWPGDYLQCDTFISNGQPFDFEPRYSYKGFRYIEVCGYEGELTAEDVTLYRVGNDIAAASTLSCSEARIMQLHEMMNRTIRNNFQGKPTDTPVWEKNGWLGDANVALSSMLYMYDMQAFFKEFIRTMQDNLHLYGLIPVMVPTAAWYVDNLPLWNSVFLFGAEAFLDRFGDEKLLADIYPDLVTYTELNISVLKENNWRWGDHHLDDWVSPSGCKEGPGCENSSEGSGICALAFVYQTLVVMAKLAAHLNKPDDADRYNDAAQRVKKAFNANFYRPEEALYDTGVWIEYEGRAQLRTRYRQTSNLLPLAFGLVPEGDRQRVFDRLCQDVIEKDYHLDCGCIGTPYVLPVLTNMGRADIAYRILLQDTYPSWGYWIKQGADTMWESWEDTSRSKDHYFLGTCEEFFFSHIVGIREISEGWQGFVIQPDLMDFIGSAGATIRTVRGDAACHWVKDGEQVTMDITVPFGATAELRLPGRMQAPILLHAGIHHLSF